MALWVLGSQRNEQAVRARDEVEICHGGVSEWRLRFTLGDPGRGLRWGGRGLRGRLDLVQSDMTTVIEDRRQEPMDEERLCAGDGGSVRLLNVFLCIP